MSLFSNTFPIIVPSLGSLSTIATPGISEATNKSPILAIPITLVYTLPANPIGINPFSYKFSSPSAPNN